MGTFIDLTGKKFGKLKVIERLDNDKNGNATWLCLCDCGRTSKVTATSLLRGRTKSCGKCPKILRSKYYEYRQKSFWNRISTSYKAMIGRCYERKNVHYADYGGRGISVCEEWRGEKGRINFYEWAIANGYAEGLTIDRIDVNGNYEPSNCRWANLDTQANNKRNNFLIECNGETKTIHEWSKISGVSVGSIRYRITHNWEAEKAIFLTAVVGRNQSGTR